MSALSGLPLGNSYGHIARASFKGRRMAPLKLYRCRMIG